MNYEIKKIDDTPYFAVVHKSNGAILGTGDTPGQAVVSVLKALSAAMDTYKESAK